MPSQPVLHGPGGNLCLYLYSVFFPAQGAEAAAEEEEEAEVEEEDEEEEEEAEEAEAEDGSGEEVISRTFPSLLPTPL